MSSDRTADVLVIGAGPVGLFTALCLSERGVKVAIVDKYHRAASHTYALALHPRTLELLDRRGLVDTLIEHGQPVRKIRVRTPGRTLGTLDLSALDRTFPFVLVVSQSLLEGVLESWLNERGVVVEWNHPAMCFDTAKGRVETLVTTAGDTDTDVSAFRIASSFLVGADGALSLTRRLLGIEYRDLGRRTGHGVVEFRAPIPARDEVQLVLNGQSTDVLWPIAADRGRWSVELSSFEHECDVGTIREILKRRAPWFDARLDRVDWTTTVAFDRKLATRFGRGRMWLAGDSAHLTCPVGAQSMNVGLEEAHDLAGRLADVLQGKGPADLLRMYDQERRREWRRLLGADGRFEVSPEAPRWAVDYANRLREALPVTGDDLTALLGQIGLVFPGGRSRTTTDEKTLPGLT